MEEHKLPDMAKEAATTATTATTVNSRINSSSHRIHSHRCFCDGHVLLQPLPPPLLLLLLLVLMLMLRFGDAGGGDAPPAAATAAAAAAAAAVSPKYPNSRATPKLQSTYFKSIHVFCIFF